MAHEKTKAIITLVAVFAIIGAASWVLVNAQHPAQQTDQTDLPDTMPKFRLQEDIRDATIACIKTSHPEIAHLTDNLNWTGGKVSEGTYVYQSNGWNITISYPDVANPVYELSADYSVPPSSGPSIMYRIMWQGTWQNGQVTETDYMCLM